VDRRDCYTFIVTRAVAALFLALAVFAQKPAPVEPPEEDASLKEKEYSLNPLQAEKEYKIGLYYAKKKSWKAAANRFGEAVKWNPGYADAHYKRAEMLEHLGNKDGAREAWQQFLEAAPDDKRVAEVQKKLKVAAPASQAAGK
jgi:tetratricopeptide (TPR) repeat protein